MCGRRAGATVGCEQSRGYAIGVVFEVTCEICQSIMPLIKLENLTLVRRELLEKGTIGVILKSCLCLGTPSYAYISHSILLTCSFESHTIKRI